jgi:hypothetical protein
LKRRRKRKRKEKVSTHLAVPGKRLVTHPETVLPRDTTNTITYSFILSFMSNPPPSI